MTFTTCKQSTLLCTIEHLIFEFLDLKLWRCWGCTCAAYATFSLTHGNSTHAVNKAAALNTCDAEGIASLDSCRPLSRPGAKSVQLIENFSNSTMYSNNDHWWWTLNMRFQFIRIQTVSDSTSCIAPGSHRTLKHRYAEAWALASEPTAQARLSVAEGWNFLGGYFWGGSRDYRYCFSVVQSELIVFE